MAMVNGNVIQEVQVELVNVKANPSVYSPNDGGFNSEENMRWAVKKLATKPFIIGETKDIVDNSLRMSFDRNTLQTKLSGGMCSIDGYTIKIADKDNISFDDPIGENVSAYIENKQIQQFISTLTGYGHGKDVSLQNTISEFCLSYYDPSGSSASSRWKDAAENGLIIGATRLVYSGEIKDLLTVESNKIYFNPDYKIDILDIPLTEVQNSDGSLKVESISAKASIRESKAFAVPNGESYNIYYSVYVNIVNSKYIIHFTDIFGIEFSNYYESVNHTKSYPYTGSIFVDMNNNEPLNNLGATSLCDPTTMPTRLYNWFNLYNISGNTLNRKTNTNIETEAFPQLTSIFDKFTIQDLLQYIPEDNKILEIDNTLEYYCLRVADSYKIQQGTKYIPIAFMLSNGELCTDGFVAKWDGKTDSDNYPVESYVHFIKRQLENIDIDTIYNGNDINLAKYVSFYLSLCYSSIMENTVHNTATNDYQKIKSDGCGNALQNQGISGIVVNDYDVEYEYEYSGYKKENTSFVVTQNNTTMRYFKDSTSDNFKVLNSCLKTPIVSTLSNFSVPETLYDTLYDDPANFIYKCRSSNVSRSLPSFKLYYFGNNSGNVVITPTGTTNRIALDENYLPVKNKNIGIGKNGYVRDTDLVCVFETFAYGTYSLSKSLCYTGFLGGWSATIPQVISLNKDTLNYLCGEDMETGKYKGISIKSILPSARTNNDLYVCDAFVETVKTGYVNDSELNYIRYNHGDNPEDKKFDVRRGAFLHVSKIYGDNEQTLEEYIKSLIEELINTDIEELIRRIEALENTVDGDGTEGNPGLKKIILGDTILNINGLKNDVDDLKLRVTSLETRAGNTDLTLKNLTEASGKIGQNAMYIVKKFGATNITGYGSTFDFNMNMSKSEASSEPNIQSGISDLSVLCENDIITDVYISDKITRLGDKLLYHCAKLNSVNSGNIVSLSISEEQIESGVQITNHTVSTLNKGIVPLTVLITANGQTYHDDSIGNIYLTTDSNNIKGTINYETGLITFNSLNNTSAVVKYKYYNAVTDGVVQRNTLPSSIQVLGDQVFAQDIDKGYKGTGITDITFPSGLKKIGSACFWGSALTTLNVPNSVTDVGQYVFSYSEDLTNVIYDGRVIGDYAFAFCTSLHDMQIGFSCLTIGRKCFTYCQNFENDKIVFIGDAYVWWNISKGEDWASKLGYITDSISNINSIECYRTGSPNAVFTYERNYYLQNGYQYRLTTYGDITIPQIIEGQPITQGFVFCTNSDVLYVNPSTLTITNANLPVDISVGDKIPLYPFIDSVNVYTYNSETGQYEETAATSDQLSSIDATYSYSSSDTSVARIIVENETYKVEAMSSGTASIIISANISGYTADLTISIDIN